MYLRVYIGSIDEKSQLFIPQFFGIDETLSEMAALMQLVSVVTKASLCSIVHYKLSLFLHYKFDYCKMKWFQKHL